MKRLPRRGKSLRDEWETPGELVDLLAERLRLPDGRFILDVAATASNRKAPEFLADAFIEQWYGDCFCNPPYSEILRWVRRVNDELGRTKGNIVTSATLLVPGNTETAWYREAMRYCKKIYFLYPRVRFIPPESIHESGNTSGSHALYLARGGIGNIHIEHLNIKR